MTPTNEKAAEGQTQTALDTTGRQANLTGPSAFVQCMRESASLAFQSACDDAKQIGALDGITKRRMGVHILRTLLGGHACSEIAQNMEAHQLLGDPVKGGW